MATMSVEQVNIGTQVTRHGGLFDKLSADTMRELLRMAHVRTHEAGETLFSESDESDFVYIMLEGRVKLSVSSTGGRRLIVGHATVGEFVGVASLMCGRPQEMAAETVYTSKVGAIGRNNFLNFLLRHPDVYRVVSEELGREFNRACEQLRTVVLSTTAPQKLARLLLEWGKDGQVTESGARFRFCMTHEELGECIGASRETVTRVMTTFKTKKLVMLNGSTLTIPNTMALENVACARVAFS
jgi:CRP/FNR family cyclic AMP-dependent transcriptional regulator